MTMANPMNPYGIATTTFFILKATSTDRQTRRLLIFKIFAFIIASDNTLIIANEPSERRRSDGEAAAE